MNARASFPSNSLALALLTAWLLPAAGWARTPDAATPAEEGVCDVLHDATPGLYGLCVGYCEAQDCDSVDQALSGQCQTPNPVLLDLFDRKRRDGDPTMPCLSPPSSPPPPCRCFGYEDLAALDVDVCQEFEELRYDVVALSDGEEQDGAVAQRGDGWGACFLIVDGDEVGYEISEEEAFACETLIRYTALQEGMACE